MGREIPSQQGRRHRGQRGCRVQAPSHRSRRQHAQPHLIRTFFLSSLTQSLKLQHVEIKISFAISNFISIHVYLDFDLFSYTF